MKNCVRVSEELNIEFIKEYVILISKFKAIPLIRKTVIPAALGDCVFRMATNATGS